MSTQAAISEDSTASSPILEAPLPPQVLHDLYATMLRARLLAKRLHQATPLCEAFISGALHNAEQQDIIVSAEPSPVLEMLRGADLADFLRPKKDEVDQIGDRKVVAAATSSFAGVAAGLAIGSLRGGSGAVTVVFAPGKSTQGAAFDESTAFAAKHRLPIIFLADWTGARRSSRNHEGRDLSHWPCPTIAVDGRDVIAVYRVTKEAIGAARRGHGPTLVDCVNFLAPGARGRDDRDPLTAYRGYLKRHNAWSDLWHSELLARVKQETGAFFAAGK
jgi:hypothetical protein